MPKKPGASGKSVDPPENARPLRLLVVEDDDDTRTSLERLLRILKHEVVGANSAAAARDLCAREK